MCGDLDLARADDCKPETMNFSQVGWGKSSLLSESKYNNLWTKDTFVEELEVFIRKLSLKKGRSREAEVLG